MCDCHPFPAGHLGTGEIWAGCTGATGTSPEMSLGPLSDSPAVGKVPSPTPFFLQLVSGCPDAQLPSSIPGEGKHHRVFGVTTRLKITKNSNRPPPAALRFCTALRSGCGAFPALAQLVRGPASPPGSCCALSSHAFGPAALPRLFSSCFQGLRSCLSSRDTKHRQPQNLAENGVLGI